VNISDIYLAMHFASFITSFDMEEIINVKNEALAQISSAKSKEEIEELRIIYLGRNGKFNQLIKKLKEIDITERKHFGETLNSSKRTIEEEFENRKNGVNKSNNVWFDPTIPGKKPITGHIHLISKAISEITNVFEKIGFTRVRYPEVEWDYYSFESLNFDKWHPARDDWETFWLDVPAHTKYGPMLLTPHTSSGQVREMLRKKTPPIRMINIAKCYRRQSDASHYPMFHQFEGLVIDENISIVNLKGTLDYFAKEFFGPNRKTRLRPYNFPFTEPSFEIDITCDICDGKGCKVCKAGWLELAGAGMVHPNVLRNGGIDPKKYTGFAFGTGVERVLMMKSGLKIPDLRLIYSTDMRFLEQF
jgi:phenylalanyl-tRNA synthetase alpha chain